MKFGNRILTEVAEHLRGYIHPGDDWVYDRGAKKSIYSVSLDTALVDNRIYKNQHPDIKWMVEPVPLQ